MSYLSTSSCPICFTPFNFNKHITLPCHCICCLSCLNDWMVLKIREPSFSSNKTTPCFSQRCPGTFQIEAIYRQLPKAHREQIDQELLNSYLIRAPDVRKCPNLNCSFAGTIDVSARCVQPLKCESCQTTWRDPLHIPRTEKLLAVTTINEACSSLWKELWTKKCPGCQRPIQKNGGCPHMRCSHCEMNFCWTCQGDHDILRHTSNALISCIPIFFIMVIAFSVIYQIPSVSFAINFVVKDIKRFLERKSWFLVWYGFLCAFCVIVQLSFIGLVIAVGYFLYQTFTGGSKKLLFRPTQLFGMFIVNVCVILFLYR